MERRKERKQNNGCINEQVRTVNHCNTILLGTCWKTWRSYHQIVLLEESGEARVHLLILHLPLKFISSQLRASLHSPMVPAIQRGKLSRCQESPETEKLKVLVSAVRNGQHARNCAQLQLYSGGYSIVKFATRTKPYLY